MMIWDPKDALAMAVFISFLSAAVWWELRRERARWDSRDRKETCE